MLSCGDCGKYPPGAARAFGDEGGAFGGARAARFARTSRRTFQRMRNRVEEMIYHRSGNEPPKLVLATWMNHKPAGPLLVSVDHGGTFDGGPARFHFGCVGVE